jgi:hypothetical protein
MSWARTLQSTGGARRRPAISLWTAALVSRYCTVLSVAQQSRIVVTAGFTGRENSAVCRIQPPRQQHRGHQRVLSTHSAITVHTNRSAHLQEAFSLLLTADFFVVLGFLGYFVVAIAARSLFQNGTLLDRFSDLWAPVIQPALGVLMAGTIVSGTVSQLSAGGEDE